MWERIKQSETVVRQSVLPVRVLLDRDAEIGEYRTFLEFVVKNCEPTFMNGRIFTDQKVAREELDRRRHRL